MKKTAALHEFFEDAIPLTLPVEPEHVNAFFDVLFKYMPGNNVFRLLFESFGTEATIRFLSNFHGMSMTIQPRAFWSDKFRDVHIYMVLRAISKRQEPALWKKTVANLAREYEVTPKKVFTLFSGVQVKARPRVKEKKKK